MGGHAAGEVASRIAAETILGYISNVANRKNPEELPDSGRRLSKQANRLLAGIHLANQSVYDLARGNPQYAGMGTTISAVFLTDYTFITANVGDSPVFLIRDEQIQMVSTLHTVASAAMAANPDGEPLNEEFKHMLTQAVGTKTHVAPDTVEQKCMIPEDMIMDTVSGEKAAAACKKLVDLANEKGGLDNITVIVIKIKNVDKPRNIFSRIGRFFNKTK